MDVKIISIEILDQEMFRSHGALSYDNAIEVIEDTLDLTHRNIHGLQKFGVAPRRIDIAVESAVWYNNSVQDSIDETVRLCSGKFIVIGVPNQLFTDVWVKQVPMDWTKDRVERIFGYYGNIRHSEKMHLMVTEMSNSLYTGKDNGVIKIKMKIKKPIPSNMSIDQSRIEIYYKDQIRTCWKCGLGHIKADCETHWRDFVNRFSMDDFPDLKPPLHLANDNEPENDHEPESETNVETPMENGDNEVTENTHLGNIENGDNEETENTQLENIENAQMSENNSQEKSEENTGEKLVVNEENVLMSEDNSFELFLENTQTITAGNLQETKVEIHQVATSQNVAQSQIQAYTTDETLTASETEQIVKNREHTLGREYTLVRENIVAESSQEFSSQPTPAQRNVENKNGNETLETDLDIEMTESMDKKEIDKRKRQEASSTEDESNIFDASGVTHFKMLKQQKFDEHKLD